MMRNSQRKKIAAIGSLALVAAITLVGCTPSSNGSTTSKKNVSASDITKALNTPTKLTLWAKLPNISDEVALFEKKYPKIQVTVVDPSTGGNEYTKLRAALKAGKGLPDVTQIEYQQIPAFVQTKSLADLAPYGAADLKNQFVPWTWKQVSSGNAVYAIPQDSGPLGNLYRQDIFAKAGIESPKTWDEFAADAQIIKDKTGSYISNLPGSDPGQIMSLFWQAGARPFSYDGKTTVGINLDSAETRKVVQLWQGLIQKDLVATDTDFSDNWYQGLARGKYASWQTAAWGPVFLQGTAKGTSGKWRAADIPQWSAGENVSGNWGGSTDAVLAASPNKIAAYELAKFINTDPQSTQMLTTKQFLFPTTTKTLNSSAFKDETPAFYGGQKVNSLFADISKTVPTDFEWLPFMDYVYSSFTGTLGDAIANHKDMTASLAKWQSQVVTYAKQQGFTVK